MSELRASMPKDPRRLLATYWRLVLRPKVGRLILLGFSSAVAAVAEVASLGLIMPIIGVIGGEASGGAGTLVVREATSWLRSFGLDTSQQSLLLVLLIAMAGLVVIRNIVLLLTGRLIETTGARVLQEFARRVYVAHLRADYGATISRRRGGMIEVTTNSAKDVSSFFIQSGMAMAAAIELVFVAAFLFWVSWWMFIVFMVFAVLVRAVLYYGIQQPSLKRTYVRMRAEQDVASHVAQGLEAIKIVKAYNLADRLADALGVAQRAQYQYRVFFGMMPRFQAGITEVFGALLLVVLATIVVLVPQVGADFAALSVFAATLLRVLPTAHRLNSLFVSAARDLGSVAAVDEALHGLPAEPQGGTTPVPSEIRSISLQDVSFAYPSRPNQPVLRGLDAELRRGRLTALIGRTGAGKTTAADLLLRVYRPTAGRILADGIDVEHLPVEEWRRRIGYVPQDGFLFNASVRDNITSFDPSVSENTLREAARVAQVEEFVHGLQHGYDTIVGDRGVQLSGGQRQRISIARALAREPQILILDEATSALDNLTEKAFQQAINDVKAQGIVLVIAHRLTTVRDADEIIVLENGSIAERGTFDELSARDGIFSQLQHAVPGEAPGPDRARAGLTGREPVPR